MPSWRFQPVLYAGESPLQQLPLLPAWRKGMKTQQPRDLRNRQDHEKATVATVLEPGMRPRLDAAAVGHFSTLHAESLPDALQTVRERPVHAILVSPKAVGQDELPLVNSLVAQFPGVPAVAVVSEDGPVASERLLQLGACGVRHMVDLRNRDGWHKLRGLIAHIGGDPTGQILGHVIPALGEPTEQTRYFFEQLVRVAPSICTAKGLAVWLRVNPTTFCSRFYRAGLPSPKRYLVATRLLYAATFLRVPGLSIQDVAYRLEYSSAQSFGRHVRTVAGVTPAEFRRRFTLKVALEDYTARLVVPFQTSFRSFNPLQFS